MYQWEVFVLENNNDKESKNEAIEWIKSIAIAIVVAIFIKTYIFNSTYVLGNSMHPTLHEKDRLFAVKVSLYFSEPDRGDIIVLEAPDDPNKDYIKRVIGISGDKVQIKDGKVYLNDELLNEDYIEKDAYTMVYNVDTWLVPEGQVFVLGDNRDEGASKDSRYFGCVSLNQVKGITEFRYYPFNEGFGKI